MSGFSFRIMGERESGEYHVVDKEASNRLYVRYVFVLAPYGSVGLAIHCSCYTVRVSTIVWSKETMALVNCT